MPVNVKVDSTLRYGMLSKRIFLYRLNELFKLPLYLDHLSLGVRMNDCEGVAELIELVHKFNISCLKKMSVIS